MNSSLTAAGVHPTWSRARQRGAATLAALCFVLSSPASPAADDPAWSRDADGWTLAGMVGDRATLARTLARASGTVLHGDPGLLASSTTRTLALRRVALHEAWRVVLGPTASYALQCEGASRCRVWLVGAAAPAPGATSTATSRPSAPPPSAALPVTSGADDPREPDPPGLFPSE
jgi:hypothetical protein